MFYVFFTTNSQMRVISSQMIVANLIMPTTTDEERQFSHIKAWVLKLIAHKLILKNLLIWAHCAFPDIIFILSSFRWVLPSKLFFLSNVRFAFRKSPYTAFSRVLVKPFKRVFCGYFSWYLSRTDGFWLTSQPLRPRLFWPCRVEIDLLLLLHRMLQSA